VAWLDPGSVAATTKAEEEQNKAKLGRQKRRELNSGTIHANLVGTQTRISPISPVSKSF